MHSIYVQISEAQRKKNVKCTKGNKWQTIAVCVYGKAAAISAGFAVGMPTPVCAAAIHHSPEKLLNVDLVEKLNEPEARETD